MKFCSHCGAELDDEAIICPKCGCQVGEINQATSTAKSKEDPNESTTLYLLLGLFIPLVGLILFLVFKDDHPRRSYAAGKGALIGVIVNLVLGLLIGIIGGCAAASVAYGMSQALLAL